MFSYSPPKIIRVEYHLPNTDQNSHIKIQQDATVYAKPEAASAVLGC
jgi:hypothetical protein